MEDRQQGLPSSPVALEALIQNGRIALLAGGIIVGEILLSRRIAGDAAMIFVANAVAGLCLIATLFAALVGLGPLAVGGALAGSFVSHIVYLVPTLLRRP